MASEPFDKAAAYDKARANGLDHASALAEVAQEEKAFRYDFLRSKGLGHDEAMGHVEKASQPMEAPRQEDWGDKAIGMARSLNPLMSFKDEASGAAEAMQQGGANLVNTLRGKPITRTAGEAYRKAKSAEEAGDEQFATAHPLASGIGKLAAGAIPAMATGGGVLLPSLAARAGQAAGTMAAFGAVNRLGEGEGVRNRLERASDPKSVGFDMAVGAALPLALEGGRRLKEGAVNLAKKGVSAVKRVATANPQLTDALIRTASPRAGAARDAFKAIRGAVANEGDDVAAQVNPRNAKPTRLSYGEPVDGRYGASPEEYAETMATKHLVKGPPPEPTARPKLTILPRTESAGTGSITFRSGPGTSSALRSVDDEPSIVLQELAKRKPTILPDGKRGFGPGLSGRGVEKVPQPTPTPDDELEATLRASLKPKAKAGKTTREVLDADAAAKGMDSDFIRGMSDDEYVAWKAKEFGKPSERADYGKFLKKHGQTSEVRRGGHDDVTRNAEAMAKKADLQAQADALPEDAPEGVRDAIYKQWKALKDEYGRIGPLYHGSPHKFDKFDVSKIGTGEGAQAYGHGLYFAESPEVAEGYRRGLSGRVFQIGDRTITSARNGGQGAVGQSQAELMAADHLELAIDAQASNPAQYAAAQIRKYAGAGDTEADEAVKVIGRWANGGSVTSTTGAKYTAELPHASTDDFLHWDKPLSEQPEKVRKALERYYNMPIKKIGWGVNNLPIDSREGIKNLRGAGIRGVRYLDGSSRGAGEGSYNYVVFDDADVSILNREGKAAAKMLGATAATSGGLLTAALAAKQLKDRQKARSR